MSIATEAPGRELATEAIAWPDRARAIVITDAESYATACGWLLGIKDLRKKIAETFDPHVKRAHEAHKALVKEKADAEAPLTQAELLIKDRIRAYDAEQDRLRREEQRRADEAARQEAERIALEQAAALELEAKATGDDALMAEAEAIIDAPIIPVPVAPVAKATPKIAGVSIRKRFAFRIVNEAAIPRQYLSVNESKIRGVVTALGLSANIPGVQVYEETSVAAGRR